MADGRGWIMEKTKLESFFTQNLNAYGFYGHEIQDFIDYWIPRLNAEEYDIYPQTAETIDEVLELNISEQTHNLLRLFYVIQKRDIFSPNPLPEPVIADFSRTGYFAAEWGVVLK